jgi:hypothetical protein
VSDQTIIEPIELVDVVCPKCGNIEHLKKKTYQTRKELSRFCLHPEYSSHNLASWFLAKTMRHIRDTKEYVKVLVTFADLVFDHHGIIYKATNWIEDGIIDPTYWYMVKNGHIIHKKTLYVHARSIRMQESEFAKNLVIERSKLKIGLDSLRC